MESRNKPARRPLNKNRIVLFTIVACVLVLGIEAAVLIHAFGKKNKSGSSTDKQTSETAKQTIPTAEPTAEAGKVPEKDDTTVWRVARCISTQYLNGIETVWRVEFEYDELGRETLRSYWWYQDGQVKEQPGTQYKRTYYGGGCVIEEKYFEKGEVVDTVFFTEEGLICGGESVLDYQVGPNGNLTELTTVYSTTESNDYYPTKWEFDAEGKIMRSVVYDCYDHETEYIVREYDYGADGVIHRFTEKTKGASVIRSNPDFDSVQATLYERYKDRRMVSKSNYDLNTRYAVVYQGDRCKERTEYADIDESPDRVVNEKHFYYPNGNFAVLANMDPHWLESWMDESGYYWVNDKLYCYAETDYSEDGEASERSRVEFNEDGQPARMYMGEFLRVEYRYDESGNVCERIAYNYDCDIIDDLRFRLDENGNLASVWYRSYDDSRVEFEWIAINVPEEAER